MWRNILLALISPFAAVWANAQWANDHPDRVESLPGWNAPLPSRWFSGYLSYSFHGTVIHTHYVLVLSENEAEAEDKLIYWSNGGPGASSLYGLFTEIGPLILNDDSMEKGSAVPILQYNHHAWTRLGSILVFDQPAPVGFSFCGEDKMSTSCKGVDLWTDELASESAYLALQEFYARFPDFKAKQLFLVGESYAGIYIPMLAREILRSSEPHSLQGFAVGDACLGTETTVCGNHGLVDIWHALFFVGQGQLSMRAFREFSAVCHPSLSEAQEATPECVEETKKLRERIGGFYGYHLYDDCTYRNDLGVAAKVKKHDYVCGGDIVLSQYLGLHQVQMALHVPDNYFSVDNADGFSYKPTEKNLQPFYLEVAHNTSLRTLVYNGDTDPSITSLAAENWTSHLHLEVRESFRPWTIDGCRRMGGYVTRYEGQFDFLTIRGAGHMVPTYKPEASLTFLYSWIMDAAYPYYDPDC